MLLLHRPAVLLFLHMRITLHIGESKTILLQKEAVGGYNWQLQNPDEESLQISTSILPAKSKVIGAGAVLEVKITATKKGTFMLLATYCRSWEKQAAKVQQYEVVVL